MLKRKIMPVLRARLADYPAVALVGPRQSGKTTLAREFGGRYYDMEQETDRLRVDLEWEDSVHDDEIVVLDEAQAWPEIFLRLRGEIDRDRKRHRRFLLLGSVSPALMRQVTESLAGRLSVVELTPLVLAELENDHQRQRLWSQGGYPDGGVLDDRGFPLWQRDHLNLLVQRDLPNWGLPAKPRTTHRLLHMLARSHGQEWSASQIGKSLGISYHTVNSYLDYLEGAFLLRRLPAYHGNFGKRLVKRPKVYWRDAGLLHALLGVSHRDELLNQPWVGASWEGFVIDQVLSALQYSGTIFEAFHFRTSDQHEIDLLIETGNELWAMEIKLTAHPKPGQMERLEKVADMVGADRRFLVCQRYGFAESGNRILCDLEGLVDYIERSANVALGSRVHAADRGRSDNQGSSRHRF